MIKMMKRFYIAMAMLCALAIAGFVNPSAAKAATPTDAQIEAVVKKIVKDNTKKSMTKSQKLKALFKYVEKNCNYKADSIPKGKTWYKKYGYNFLTKKRGNCYGYAAAYALLAKKATGYSVRVVTGGTAAFGKGEQYHAWTEVKIGGEWYVFDTNLDQKRANSTLKYYMKKHSSAAMKKTYLKHEYNTYYTVK